MLLFNSNIKSNIDLNNGNLSLEYIIPGQSHSNASRNTIGKSKGTFFLIIGSTQTTPSPKVPLLNNSESKDRTLINADNANL